MSRATIIEVAKAAGVSKSSVSNILRDDERCRHHPETVRRVREAAELLGYQVNSAAQALRQMTTKRIGLMIEKGHPHLDPLVASAYDELLARGYEPILCEARQMTSTTPFPGPELLAGVLSIDLFMEAGVSDVYRVLQSRLPVIALYPVSGVDVECVTSDRARAIELAVEHLVSLGHHRIVFVHPCFTVPSSRLKTKGWAQAVKKYGISANENYEIDLSAFDVHNGIGRSIARIVSQLDPQPTALICSNDTSALDAIYHLTEAGWKVPEAISVVGYGGHEHGEYSRPRLTTVVPAMEEVAEAAVRRLIELIEKRHDDKEPPRQQYNFEPRLLVRDSTTVPTLTTFGNQKQVLMQESAAGGTAYA